MAHLIETKGLTKHFPIRAGFLRKTVGIVRAVDGAEITAERGKTLALVGESGSGKTTLGRMLVKLEEPTSGSILYEGRDITRIEGNALRTIRRRIQMVFQDPTSALNPRRRIRDILLDPLEANNIGTRQEKNQMVHEIIRKVGLPDGTAHQYPYALSGGQKQRIGVARALILKPDLVVLDEPTSSLDVSVQANIISLLRQLQKEYNLAYVFISHNLSLVRTLADEVAVMYLGRIMEKTTTRNLYGNPLHPYSAALLSVIPTISDKEQGLLPERIKIVGEVPSPSKVPIGCRFVTRCPKGMHVCTGIEPTTMEVDGHELRCHLYASDSSHTFPSSDTSGLLLNSEKVGG